VRRPQITESPAQELEVGHLFRGLVVAAALDLDLGRGLLDLGELIG
jgi:hypothetical protein